MTPGTYVDRVVTAGTQLAVYAYNADGIRTAKVTQQGFDRYLLNGGNVAAEADENGNITNYIRGVNLICRDDGTDRDYYLFNAHGDVVNLVDGVTAAVTRAYAYDAFGNEKNPVSTDKNPFRYCGEYRDSETDT